MELENRIIDKPIQLVNRYNPCSVIFAILEAVSLKVLPIVLDDILIHLEENVDLME
jgi:hypothetical protein